MGLTLIRDLSMPMLDVESGIQTRVALSSPFDVFPSERSCFSITTHNPSVLEEKSKRIGHHILFSPESQAPLLALSCDPLRNIVMGVISVNISMEERENIVKLARSQYERSSHTMAEFDRCTILERWSI